MEALRAQILHAHGVVETQAHERSTLEGTPQDRQSNAEREPMRMPKVVFVKRYKKTSGRDGEAIKTYNRVLKDPDQLSAAFAKHGIHIAECCEPKPRLGICTPFILLQKFITTQPSKL